MAAVTCRVCRTENDPDDEACGNCGSPLPRRRASAPEPGPTRPQVPSPVPAAPPPAPSPGGGDPFGSGASAALRVPGGRVITLEAGDRLMIGRGRDSPLAALCSDNISRRHAFVGVRDDGVYVADETRSTGRTSTEAVSSRTGSTPSPAAPLSSLAVTRRCASTIEVSEGSQ